MQQQQLKNKQMKIVILDRGTLGDVPINQLLQFGEVVTYDTTPQELTVERINDAEVVIVNKILIGEEELKLCENLKLICVSATGYNNIDVPKANEYGVAVTNVKNYSTESVAQYVFTYIMALSNSVFGFRDEIKNNYWQSSKIFTSLNYPIGELSGKKLGIIGYGNIGKRVAEIGRAFKMEILISKRKNDTNPNSERVDFETVLAESDFLTIHCPMTETTKNLITSKELEQMKKTAILINSARGGIVNEQDLFEALRDEKIRYAVVDVLTQEPPTNGNILYNAQNIIITPHIAWTSREARSKLFDGIMENIQTFIDGNIDDIRLI